MATATKTKAPVKIVSESDRNKELETSLSQAAAENAALQHRITQLAGFETEVRSLRESRASTGAQIASLTLERDNAVRAASQAQAAALNASASAGIDAKIVGHAQALAAAVKGLIS